MTRAAPNATTEVTLTSKLFRGLGDPTRLAILLELADDELRVTDLVERLHGSQGNISGHLACLKDCGLVIDRRVGREAFYRVGHREVIVVLRAAEELLAVTGCRVDLCSRYGMNEEIQ